MWKIDNIQTIGCKCTVKPQAPDAINFSRNEKNIYSIIRIKKLLLSGGIFYLLQEIKITLGARGLNHTRREPEN